MHRYCSRLNKISRCIILLLCLVLCIGLLVPLSEAIGTVSTQVIRVGNFLYEGFLDRNEDGTYTGYAFDYLQEIAQYTGWEYEYVDVTWDQSLEMLENGEIDIMGTLLLTPERAEVFDFSDLAMGSGYGVLATNLDNEALSYEDFLTFDGLRVGVLKGNRQQDKFISYSDRHSFTPVIKEYSTQEQMDKALHDGEIEAVVMTSFMRTSELRIIAKFGEENFYFATTKGNGAVLNQLNKAMDQIQLSQPYYNSNLNRKYFDLQVSTHISFTNDELEYIKSNPVIKCVYHPADRPISYNDNRSGSLGGIAADVCALLELKTGLSIEYVDSGTYEEALELFSSPETTLLMGVTHNFAWAREHNAFLTTPFLNGQVLMVTKDTPKASPVIAVYNQTELTLSQKRSASEIKYYDTAEECLNAVRNGKADVTYINSNVMSYYMNNPKYLHLRSSSVYGQTVDTCIAVDNRTDPRLVSILNKALGSISNIEISGIITLNTKTDYFNRLTSFIYARPFDFALIIAVVLLVLAAVLMVLFRNRAKSARAMKDMLMTDALTGYPNYRALTEAGPRLLGTHPEKYALVYTDMHQFKYINDTLGYDAGDRLLISISEFLKRFTENDELFARIYADKFVLLLRFNGQESFIKRLDKLSDGFDSLSVGEFEMANLLFSGGIFRLQKDACDLDMACDRANYAKDTIKEFFANTFVFYDDVIRKQLLSEKMLESSMRRALDNGEFVPYFQPKVNVLSGEVIGVEALARWDHPTQGCLSPAHFVPFYEKTGFIVKIDFAIFDSVCNYLSSWIAAGNETVPISINFSRRHMLDHQFIEKIMKIVDHYKIPTSLLEIEITETVEVEKMELAVNFARALKEKGFSISIDDYGTGYSSIAFLQELPFDVLKLDKLFVENAMRNQKARDIMRNLVRAVKDNGMRVICEGIETKEQRDFIISQNCLYAQGYLYARPMPRDEFERYLSGSSISQWITHDYISSREFEQRFLADSSDFLNRVMPGGIIACNIDEQFSIFYINEHLLADLGYSEAEFIQATDGSFLNALHPLDRQRVIDDMNGNMDCSDEYILQYRMLHKNGEAVWIRDVGKRVTTDGNRDVLLCICTNITDLVNLELENNLFLNTVPGGICDALFVDGHLMLQNATEKFYELIGHTPEQLEQKKNDLLSIVCPKDFEVVRDTIRNTISSQESSCNYRFHVVFADGSLHRLSVITNLRSTPEGIMATSVIIDFNDKQ